MPSPATSSLPAPSSVRVTEVLPGSTSTTTLPFGPEQLMLMASSAIVPPIASVIGSKFAGRIRACTTELLQLRAFAALRRPPVTVGMLYCDGGTVPASVRFFRARQSRVGSCALSKATTPVTNGVAIDVPSKVS